ADPEDRAEQARHEVGAVLELFGDVEAPEGGENAEFHPPTAPYLRSPRVQASRYAPTHTASHTTCPTNPCTSAAPCTVPVSRSTGNASMYGNQRNPATRATAGGSSASGASRPERNSEIPACSSMMAVARVVQNASSPVAKLMKNRIAAASRTAAAVSAHRPPPNGRRTAGHAGAATRRTHAPQQPQPARRPVLQLLQPRGPQQRAVTPQPTERTGHASSPSPCANAWRITSSIGGSSIDRSATGSAARSRALVAAASSR